METGKIVAMSPWHPVTDPVLLKYLSKLSEETGELSAAIGRCICQGVGESSPDNGKPNRILLEEEIADVLANIQLVADKFSLNWENINKRIDYKIHLLRQWHEMA